MSFEEAENILAKPFVRHVVVVSKHLFETHNEEIFLHIGIALHLRLENLIKSKLLELCHDLLSSAFSMLKKTP